MLLATRSCRHLASCQEKLSILRPLLGDAINTLFLPREAVGTQLPAKRGNDILLSARRGCRPCVFCWGKLSTLRSLPGEAIDNVPPASRSCRDWIPCQEKLLTLLFTPLIRYRHADPCSEKLSTLSILPREAVDTASWQEKALQFLPGEAINSLCPARTICPRFVPARGSFLQFVSCQEKHRPFASCQEKLSALDNLPVEAGDTSLLVRRS